MFGIVDREAVLCHFYVGAASVEDGATGVELDDLFMSLEELDEFCVQVGLPIAGKIVFTVGSKRPPVQVVRGSLSDGTSVSGLDALMAGATAACSRSTFLTPKTVSALFKESTNKGGLAAQFCDHLYDCGAGFLTAERYDVRKMVFLRVLNVLWHVTPELLTSFKHAVTSCNRPVELRNAFTAAEQMLGCPRSNTLAGDPSGKVHQQLAKLNADSRIKRYESYRER